MKSGPALLLCLAMAPGLSSAEAPKPLPLPTFDLEESCTVSVAGGVMRGIPVEKAAKGCRLAEEQNRDYALSLWSELLPESQAWCVELVGKALGLRYTNLAQCVRLLLERGQ